VLCCAKHFPGHGDTASESHLELPLLEHSRERLEAVELPPFREAIAEGVASVMTAHLLLPSLDPERPATLSAAVLSDLLRRDLGFAGLVVTDALVMEAISGRYGAGEAAVLALEAGADLVLMPADAQAAIEAIVSAIEAGRLTEERLEASLERRRRALALLPPPASTDADPAHTPLGPLRNGPAPEDQRLALELVLGSLERQGPSGGLPVAGAAGLNLVRVDQPLACPFLPAGAPALARPAAAGLRTCLITAQAASPWGDDPQAPLDLGRLGQGAVLLQLFVRGNPFRGSAGGGEEPWEAVIDQLQGAGRLAGLAVYGSPYLWRRLRTLLHADIPAAYSPAQMPLAQEAVLASLGLGEAPALAGAAEAALAPGDAAADRSGFTD
jgi:beta-glucosidase